MKGLLIALAVVLPGWSAAAHAKDIRVRVGAGAQVQPKFIGSDERQVGPLFHINVAKAGKEFKFAAPDDSFGIGVVSKNGFVIGPAANFQMRRKESDVGAPVGNVGRTIEAGAFAQYAPNDSFRVRGEILKGLNGHDGLLGSIGADKIWRDGDRYLFSIGPRLLFSDSRYQRAYFGVSPATSLASGLPTYRPGGGVHGVAVTSTGSYELNGSWGLFGFARYERLVGDAAKSPIIRQLGSRNQLSAGVGVNYIFNFHL
jgi:outer membrane protein